VIPPIENLLSALVKLPGIGRRSAERVVFYLLAKPAAAAALQQALAELSRVKRCQRCGNFAVETLCSICEDAGRDQTTICVVAHPWEIPLLEKTGAYQGLYHVLGGLISPARKVGPEDLGLERLVERVRTEGTQEVILALESKAEGDLTAMYILRQLKPLGVRVSQIAQGVPVGRDLESADELTLGRALKGRTTL